MLGTIHFATSGGGQRIVATPVINGIDSHPVGLPLPTDSRLPSHRPADVGEKATINRPALIGQHIRAKESS